MTRPDEVKVVLTAAAEVWGVSEEDILSHRRFADMVCARHFSMWALWKMGRTLQSVGDVFGVKHGTVWHALEVLERRSEDEKRYREKLELFCRKVWG